MKRVLGLAAAGVLVAAVVAAIVVAGGDEDGGDGLLVMAAERTAAAGTARVATSMEFHSGDPDSGRLGQQALAAEGLIDFREDRAVLVGGGYEMRVTGGTTYLTFDPDEATPGDPFTDFISGRWLRFDQAAALGMLGIPGAPAATDPAGVLGQLRAAGDVATVGKETVRDTATTRHRVTDADPSVLEASLWGETDGGEIPYDVDRFEVWLDADGLVRRVDIEVSIAYDDGDRGPDRFVQRVEWWDFGVPVHVEAPDPADVVTIEEFEPGRPRPGTARLATSAEVILCGVAPHLQPVLADPDDLTDDHLDDLARVIDAVNRALTVQEGEETHEGRFGLARLHGLSTQLASLRAGLAVGNPVPLGTERSHEWLQEEIAALLAGCPGSG